MGKASTAQAFSRRIAHLTRMGILAVIAGLILSVVLVLGTRQPEPLPMAASALQAERLELPDAVGRESSDTVFRPLFWESRRPLQEPDSTVIADAVTESGLDGVALVGVYAAGGVSGAILSVNGARTRLALGERLEGWRLLQVDATEVVFAGTRNNVEQQVTLRLERNTHE
jgi:hypothetical protein